eukprot:12119746-Alexandrium_andersonii.AAC.1
MQGALTRPIAGHAVPSALAIQPPVLLGGQVEDALLAVVEEELRGARKELADQGRHAPATITPKLKPNDRVLVKRLIGSTH